MAQTADGSWLASVSAAAVLVSLDPKGPAEVEAAPPEEGASLCSAGLASEESLAAGPQTHHWSQADWQVCLSQNCGLLVADPE